MIYVISDIHGREDRFNEVLKRIKFGREDHLYILGDVIDRNPDGISLLNRIRSADNMTMLLGNHEYMMLEALEHPRNELKNDLWLYANGGLETFESWKKCTRQSQKEIMEYLHDLPLNIELSYAGKDWLLVHGGPCPNFRNKWDKHPERGEKYYAVWHRIAAEEPMPAGKTVIFGHTPTMHYQTKDPMEIFHGKNMIGIDCGCAYANGRLACLRLDDGAEFYSGDE